MPNSPPGSDGPAAFPPTSSPRQGFIDRWFGQDAEAGEIASRSTVQMTGYPPTVSQTTNPPPDSPKPEFVLKAAITLGERTPDGHVVEAVSIPWLALLEHLKRHPTEMHQLGWREWEEIIAAGYKDAGYSVILTPRSGDKGRDVIATLNGVVSVRIFDQVKAYKPGNVVTREDVTGMLGLLSAEPNVSMGVITTTSDFAPGVYDDENIKRFMPHRLDLRPGDKLMDWLNLVRAKKGS
jgi:restriction system protein